LFAPEKAFARRIAVECPALLQSCIISSIPA